MAKTLKNLLHNTYSYFAEKRHPLRTESKEYLHVGNQYDSDEDGIVYPSEEMQRQSDGVPVEDAEKIEKKSEKTSAMQAAWNILNLIQGKTFRDKSNIPRHEKRDFIS